MNVRIPKDETAAAGEMGSSRNARCVFPASLCLHRLVSRAFVKETVSLLLTHVVTSCLLYQCLLYLAVAFSLLLWFLSPALATSPLFRPKQGNRRFVALASTFLSKCLLRYPDAFVSNSP